MERVETGITQGSPVSPILFLFFNAPLIEQCTRRGLPVQTGGFVDDIHLLAYSRSTDKNCDPLEKVHRICLRWAETFGATFAPKKYELVHLTRGPKRVNLTATVRLSQLAVKSNAAIRVLGLWIDTTMRWGPHLAKEKSKMADQKRALTCLSASTWGVTLHKAREVYRTVVTPMLTFAAPVWHEPKNATRATETLVKKLAVMQNDCLRSVLGAYRATPVQILEAEAEVPSMRIQLDRAFLRSKAIRGSHSLIQVGNRRIKQKLQPKRGRRVVPSLPPSKSKEAWAARSLWMEGEQMREERAEGKTLKKKIHNWWLARMHGRWRHYQQGLRAPVRNPAQTGNLLPGRLDLHKGLKKSESSVATQIRSGKIRVQSLPLYSEGARGSELGLSI